MSRPISISRLKLSQGKLFWREVGQGKPLVFLHGSTNDGTQWLPILDRLNSNYHCFAPDLLGFGESEHPKINYSIAWQVESLAEYFEALNLNQFYLVGHSLGGWIGASYALKYPEKVLGLVLISPEGVGFKGQGRRRLWSKCLMSRPSILSLTLQAFSPIAQLAGLKTKVQQSLQYRQSLLQSPTAYELMFGRDRSVIHQELLNEALQWFYTPVLILQGSQDHPESIVQSQTYAGLCKQAQLRLINLGKHDLPEAFPEYIAQEIEEFVQELVTQASAKSQTEKGLYLETYQDEMMQGDVLGYN